MWDVIVIGAGASGLMAAIASASNNKNVLLIEKTSSIGNKILISGGGRCNLINLKSTKEFIEEIPCNNKFLYSTLNNFSPEDIFNYFTELGVPLKVEDNDRVFPVSNKSIDIINALNRELKKREVKVNLEEEVTKIKIDEDIKEIITSSGSYKAFNIVIATGGLSYPHTGSTGDGYKFAKSMNQSLTDLYPADTYLITKESLPLSGITIEDVDINLSNKKYKGSILFTHKGISGPGIFKISEEVYKELKVNDTVKISIDLLPNYKKEQLLTDINNYKQNKEIKSFVSEYLPKRLSEYILDKLSLNSKVGSLSRQNKNDLIDSIKSFGIEISTTGKLTDSIVTGGGINLKYINPKTMESKINPGVYYTGEVLDLHGHMGGYNLTIAFSTGYTAGSSIGGNI